MAISGIGNYKNAMYQWQSQQLKASSSGKSGSSSNDIAQNLFDGTSSITTQISSMIELTKYAMDAMGVSKDARVTFNQIIKYRNQLQNEFNQDVKDGFAKSGIKDISSLSFKLDKNGKITVNGENADDKKTAQNWLDANLTFGQELRQSLSVNNLNNEIDVSINSSGKIVLINRQQESAQKKLDENKEPGKNLHNELENSGYDIQWPVKIIIDDSGKLVFAEENNKGQNTLLAGNAELENSVKNVLSQHGIDFGSASFSLDNSGNMHLTVNNAENADMQKILDEKTDIGKSIIAGLNNLGIDKNINFSIQINDDGSIKIASDHPDSGKVQQFFEEHPELVKKYRQIETLAGIDDARKAMQISPAAMKKRIQIESMMSWWATSEDASSYFGNYNNGSLSLLQGLNLKV